MLRIRNQRAFTLLEAVIVTVLLGLLAALAIPTGQALVRRGNVAADAQDLRSFAGSLLTMTDRGELTLDGVRAAVRSVGGTTDLETPVAGRWRLLPEGTVATGEREISFDLASSGRKAGVALTSDGTALSVLVEAGARGLPEPERVLVASGTSALLGDEAAPTLRVPTGLAAAAGVDTVSLTWSNAPRSRFRVYRDASPVAEVTSSSWVDRSVTAGVKYRYTVTAFDAAAETAHSAAATAQLPRCADLTAPAVTLSAPGTVVQATTSLTVGLTGCAVEARMAFSADGAAWTADEPLKSVKSWTFTGEGTRSVAVRVTDGNGKVGTAAVTVTVDSTPPPAPSGVSVYAGTGTAAGTLAVSWTPLDPGVVESYRVWYQTGGLGPFAEAGVTSSPCATDPCSASYALPAGEYEVYVTAHDAAGNASAPSASGSVTLP